MAPRDVTFKLTATVDPAFKEVARRFGESIQQVYDEIKRADSLTGKAAVADLTKTVTATKQVLSEVRSMADQAAAASEGALLVNERLLRSAAAITDLSASKQAAADNVKVNTDSLSQIDQARAKVESFEQQRRDKSIQKVRALEAEKLRIMQASADATRMTLEMAEKSGANLTDEQRQTLRVHLEEKIAGELERIDKKITAAKEQEARRRAAIDEREAKRQLSAAEKAQKATEAAAEKEAKANAAAARKAVEARETALASVERFTRKQQASLRESAIAAAELGESVMRFARGMVAAGLVGEKDLDKIKDRLLAIQAAFDMVGGGIQVFLKLTRTIDGLRASLIAATAAQTALNVAQGLGVGGAAAGGARAASAAAANSASNIAFTTGTSAVAGMAGHHVVTGASGGSAVAGSATSAGSALAALASSAVILTSIIDTIRGAASGQGLNFKQGSASQQGWSTFGQMIVPLAGWIDETVGLNTNAAQANRSARESSKAEKRAAARADMAARNSEMEQSIAGQMTHSAGQAMQQRDAKFDLATSDMTAAEKALAIRKEIAAEEQRIKQVREQAGQVDERLSSIREAMLADAAHGEERIINLMKKEIDATREVSREKKRGAEEALRATEKQLSLAQQATEDARKSLMSARERFGMMSQEEQQEVLQLANRAKRGGRLNEEELRKLQGLGLGSTDALVQREAGRRADEAGFGMLSRDDRRNLGQLERTQHQLEVKVNAERQFIVNIVESGDRQVAVLSKMVSDALNARDKKIADDFKAQQQQLNQLDQRMKNGAGRG